MASNPSQDADPPRESPPLTGTTSTPASLPRRYAVLIGLDVYGNDSRLNNLEGAVLDIVAIRSWLLTTQSPFLSSPPAVLITELGTLNGLGRSGQPVTSVAQPSVSEVVGLFEATIVNQPNSQSADRLYLCVAGHGVTTYGDGEPCALLTARVRKTATGWHVDQVVDVSGIAGFFITSGWFREVVFLFDGCRRLNHIPYLRSFPPAWISSLSSEMHSVRDVRAFTGLASSFGGLAYEKEIRGRMRGVFTYYFLRGLAFASRDPHGRITGRTMKDYLLAALRWYFLDEGQQPSIGLLHGDDLVLEADPPNLPPTYEAYFWLGPLDPEERARLRDLPVWPEGGTRLTAGEWAIAVTDITLPSNHPDRKRLLPLTNHPLYGWITERIGPLDVAPDREYDVRFLFRGTSGMAWTEVAGRGGRIPRAPEPKTLMDSSVHDEISSGGFSGSEATPTPAFVTPVPPEHYLDAMFYDIGERGGIVHVPV